MEPRGELNNFYFKKKRRMDKSNFHNKLPKIYNYILKNLKYNPDYKKLKKKEIEKYKYQITCSRKPSPYDSSYNVVPPIIENDINSIKNDNSFLNDILTETILIEDFNINELIDTSESFDISGIQLKIQYLDSEIQIKRAQLDDLEINTYGKITTNSTIDEFVEKKYQNTSADGTIINNDVNYLSKTQKEIEIYEKIIFILYFLLSSSLGFFYLFKNK